jgi:hypothetical protein
VIAAQHFDIGNEEQNLQASKLAELATKTLPRKNLSFSMTHSSGTSTISGFELPI